MTASFLPPFIPDQLWSVLATDADPQPFLTTRHFRTGRASGIADHEENPWQLLNDSDRIDLVNGTFSTTDHGAPARLIAFVADAGVGKTCSTEFAAMTFNTPGRGGLAVRINLADLCSQPTRTVGDWLRAELKDSIQGSLKEKSTDDVLNRLIDRQLHRGRLMIVLDGLDHVGDSRSLDVVLRDSAWHSCRFVISARPYAIQRDWKHLFAGRDWIYVRLEEFDETQQEFFLGSLSNGESRWKQIPEEARKILGVPRVLLYLRKVEEYRLNALRTAADIFNFAIDRLIEDGLTQSVDARRIAVSTVPKKPSRQQIAATRKLLAAIAYEMILQNDPGKLRPPNFDRIIEGETFDNFCTLVGTRYRGDFCRDFQALAALNNFLEHGLFDTDHNDLREIQFSNRSLLEFFCALYMATNDVSADWAQWWQWQPQPHEEESFQFYQIWQFLCDMPREAIDINNPVPWLRAIQPLYRQGNGTVAGTRRSTEMIFRSWGRLNDWRLAGQQLAQEICDNWLGEFEGILNGTELGTTPERRAVAHELKDSFLFLPKGQFLMGTSYDRQREVRTPALARYEKWLKSTLDTGDFDAGLKSQTIDRIQNKHSNKLDWLRQRRSVLHKALVAETNDAGSGIKIIMNEIITLDEVPAEGHSQEINGFSMSRMPTQNAWYSLFDPGHRYRVANSIVSDYEHVSGSDKCPVIHVSWFDAWVFSKWAFWDEKPCRLPLEREWEYAAKFGHGENQMDQNYWWGDRFDEPELRFANLGGNLGRTSEPTPEHSSEATKSIDVRRQGIMDLIGNVWEWCQDVYCVRYTVKKPAQDDATSPRALRGGAWDTMSWVARCAFRHRQSPDVRSASNGFRLVRDR